MEVKSPFIRSCTGIEPMVKARADRRYCFANIITQQSPRWALSPSTGLEGYTCMGEHYLQKLSRCKKVDEGFPRRRASPHPFWHENNSMSYWRVSICRNRSSLTSRALRVSQNGTDPRASGLFLGSKSVGSGAAHDTVAFGKCPLTDPPGECPSFRACGSKECAHMGIYRCGEDEDIGWGKTSVTCLNGPF